MITAAVLLLAALTQMQPVDPAQPFPGITIDRETKTVELAGRIAVDAASPDTPEVIIEVIAEAGGARDHEAIVTIDAEARHVHAALLLIGLEPGAPGRFTVEDERVEPTGPELTVALRYTVDGEERTADPTTWIIDRDTSQPLSELEPRFVFGGSSERAFQGQTVYIAEAEGTVVGLCTFGVGDAGTGNETVGMIPVMSPDSGSGDPIWIAKPGELPEADTPVVVVLTAE